VYEPEPQEELKTAETASLSEGKKVNKEDRTVDQRAKLKTTVENQANNNIARLRALLETAPESAKPALERAIELSENGYKKAVESLK
jgi:hypothetical protein